MKECEVADNTFLGGGGSFFHFENAVLDVSDCLFNYNGNLTDIVFKETIEDVEDENMKFMFHDYEMPLSNEFGLFYVENLLQLPYPDDNYIRFAKNIFKFNFA